MIQDRGPSRAATDDDGGGFPWHRVGLVAGILVFLAVAFVPSPLQRIEGLGARPARAAAVAALMAVWWFTEALPIAWTACAPLVLYPLLGVYEGGFAANASRSARPFIDAYVFLFLGGMALGAGMEHWGLHRRIALHIMRAVGTEPRRLLAGTLIATAFVSMWLSNTATAVMMMPIGMALLAQLEAAGGRRLSHYGAAIMLSIAYGANVGGIGTKIGTGTNSIFSGFVANTMHRDIGFLHYIAFGAPFVALFLPVVWRVLWAVGRRDRLDDLSSGEIIEREVARLGPMTANERKVAVVFLSAAVLWMAGDLLRPLLAPHVPVLWPGFKFQAKHYEAWVAMAAALVLYAWRGLPVAAMKRVPVSTLLLIGGSFAMAAGIEGSGLSLWMARGIGGLSALPLIAQIGAASLAAVFLTAVASNTATVSVLLNVLPRAMPLLQATCIGASCDFMLPAGTPPNAIVFGSGYIRLPMMMRVGFVLDVAAVLLTTLYVYGYARFLF